jgi:D-arabinose 1-dehydrogenase-like Zn-dependent alcohol dehydrogenase
VAPGRAAAAAAQADGAARGHGRAEQAAGAAGGRHIVPGWKRVSGSLICSVADCQAILDFAGKHGVGAEVEVV